MLTIGADKKDKVFSSILDIGVSAFLLMHPIPFCEESTSLIALQRCTGRASLCGRKGSNTHSGSQVWSLGCTQTHYTAMTNNEGHYFPDLPEMKEDQVVRSGTSWCWGCVAQLVECLPCMYKILGSNPSIIYNWTWWDTNVASVKGRLEGGEQKFFEAVQMYIRPWLLQKGEIITNSWYLFPRTCIKVWHEYYLMKIESIWLPWSFEKVHKGKIETRFPAT